MKRLVMVKQWVMWVATAVAKCTNLLSSPSFPKPKFLFASAHLLHSHSSDFSTFDSSTSIAATLNQLKHHPDRTFSLFRHLDSNGLPLDLPTYATFISILSPSASHLDFVVSRLVASLDRSAITSLLDSLALLGGHPILLCSIDFLVKAYL